MDPRQELVRLLDRALLRQRRLVFGRAVLAASAALAVAAGISLVALGTGWVPAEARLVLASFALAVAIVAWRLGARGVARWTDPASTVVRPRDPALYADLAGAEALAREGGGDYSEALARAHVAEVLGRVRPLGAAGLAPRSILRAGLAAWTVAASLLVVIGLALRPALVDGAARAFEARATRERPASTDRPLVGSVDLELRYPAYLDRPPLSIPSSTGEIEAPKGTRVRIRTRALAPVAEASVALVHGGRIALRRSGRSLEGEIVVREEDRYAFQIRRPDGRAVRESRERGIRVVPDAAPRPEILDPAADVTLAPEDTLRGRWRARDDVAVSEVALVVHVEGREPEKTVLASPDRRLDDLSGDFEVALPTLGLRGGESIAVTVEALDGDTVSGPNRGVSESRTISVASPASRHRALVDEQARVLDVLVGVLGDRLEMAVPGPRPARRVTDRFTRVRAGTDEATRLLALAEEGLARDKLARADVRSSLRGIRERLQLLLQREMRLHGDPLGELEERTTVDRAAVAELETDVLLLDDLLGRQRLESLRELGEEVNRTRDRIADLVRRWERSRGEAARRELLAEIARLEAQIAALYERIAELQPQVPGEFLNAEALRQVDLASQLRALRESLAVGDVRGAEQALAALQSRMQELMAALEDSNARFSGERFAEAERARQELLSEVADIEREQRGLARRTEATQERFRQRLAQEMQGRIDPLVQRLVAKTDAALAALDQAEAEPLPDFASEDLARARERVLDLRALLEQGDLDEARAMAEEASMALEATESDLSHISAGAQAAVGRARPPIDEVRDALESAVPNLPSLLGENDVRALRGQASPQRRIAQRARALRERMEGPDPELPFLGEDAARSLGEAEARMRAAAERLGDADARGALSEEDAALEELRRLRESAESPSRPLGSSGLEPPVRIPRAEEHRGPEELRRKILEALREEAPAEYADEVRRYLEELAR